MRSRPAGELRHVSQSIALGACLVPNRLVRTAHATNLAHNGEFTEELLAYHEARAGGGIGLTIFEGALVHPQTSLGLPGWLGVFDDRFIPSLERAVERLRPSGMKLFQQLQHPGSRGPSTDGTPSWSASDTPEPHSGRVPIPMTKGMIAEVVAAFAAAARRCEDAGLDGVEIHGAHGYLCHQFLSPVFNRRTDDYGGSLENRMRFLCEVLAACRASVSDGFPVGTRLSSDDFAPGGGMGPGDHGEVAAALEARGLADFIDISMSSGYDRSKAIGPMFEPEGYELATSGQVAHEVSVPTMVTGRILTLAHAEAIVAEGVADMVSMVRATIADPDIVRLSMAGTPELARPCVGCNQGCIAFLERGLPITCAVNPQSGRETVIPALRQTGGKARCLVIGGGVAGMEAARDARLSGYVVTLVEAGDELGGQLKVAATASSRAGLSRFVIWLEQELKRLSVAIRLGVRFSAADVLAEEPDLVIVATGSVRPADGAQRLRPLTRVTGLDQPHVVNSIEALHATGTPPTHALIFDDRWDVEALSVTETLLDRGGEVTFATSAPAVAPACEATLHRERYCRLLYADPRCAVHLRQELRAVRPSHATLAGLDNAQPFDVDADLVVFVGRALSCRELADELAELDVPVRVVGDALQASDLWSAVHSAYRSVATLPPNDPITVS